MGDTAPIKAGEVDYIETNEDGVSTGRCVLGLGEGYSVQCKDVDALLTAWVNFADIGDIERQYRDLSVLCFSLGGCFSNPRLANKLKRMIANAIDAISQEYSELAEGISIYLSPDSISADEAAESAALQMRQGASGTYQV